MKLPYRADSPQHLTDALNAIIGAYQTGAIAGVLMVALLERPDGENTMLIPTKALCPKTEMIKGTLRDETQQLLTRSYLETDLQRERFAREQQQTASPILDANGNPAN